MQQKRQLVTITEFARLRGLDKSTISRQVKAGQIPIHKGKIDVAAADKARAENLDQTRKDEMARRKGTAAQPAPVAPVESLATQSRLDLEKKVLFQRERKARMANDREEGRLVLTDDVRAAQSQVALTVRDSILNLPARIAADLAAQLSVDERKTFIALTSACRDFLKDLSEAVRQLPGKEGDKVNARDA